MSIVISGPGVRCYKVEHCDEISCAEGAINRIKGREFVWMQLDYLEVVPKQGTKKQQNRLKKPGRGPGFLCLKFLLIQEEDRNIMENENV